MVRITPPDTVRAAPSLGSAVKKKNVRGVPRRSGVPMSEMVRAFVGSGGKFEGIFSTVAGTPCSSRTFQKALPRRKSSVVPDRSGRA